MLFKKYNLKTKLYFLIFIFALFLSTLYYKYFIIKKIIIQQAIEHNMNIADEYRNEISNKWLNVLKQAKNQKLSTLLKNEEFIDLVKKSYSFLDRSNLKISLFDSNINCLIKNFDNNHENIIISNKFNALYHKILLQVDKYFLSNYIYRTPLQLAILGNVKHRLVLRLPKTDRDNDLFQRTFSVNTYVPIIEKTNYKFNIHGVIKITNDITKEWYNASQLEFYLMLHLFIICSILILIIFLQTQKIKTIINQQFQINRNLFEAKKIAEKESLAKTDFLANISHELRTPLNSIIGFSELILAKNMNSLECKEYISDINQSGIHLLGVINDILDLSKIIAGKLKIDMTELNLNKIISSAIRIIEPKAQKLSITIDNQMQPHEQIVVFADAKRLKQALLNLLSNAIKFTPPNGSIIINITHQLSQNTVLISIIDNGIGMKEEDIPKALSSFIQIDNKLSKNYEGSGLGLPLTQKLIELMNGKLEIYSKFKQGTTVTILLRCIEIISI